MRAYRKTAPGRSARKAFARGVEAVKRDLSDTFRRIGKGEMSGYTAAEVVKNCNPDVPRETIT